MNWLKRNRDVIPNDYKFFLIPMYKFHSSTVTVLMLPLPTSASLWCQVMNHENKWMFPFVTSLFTSLFHPEHVLCSRTFMQTQSYQWRCFVCLTSDLCLKSVRQVVLNQEMAPALHFLFPFCTFQSLSMNILMLLARACVCVCVFVCVCVRACARALQQWHNWTLPLTLYFASSFIYTICVCQICRHIHIRYCLDNWQWLIGGGV